MRRFILLFATGLMLTFSTAIHAKTHQAATVSAIKGESKKPVILNPEALAWADKNVTNLDAVKPEKRTAVYFAISLFWKRIKDWRKFKPFYDKLFSDKEFRRKYPFFINPDEGLFIALLKDGMKITDLSPFRRLAGKTVAEVYGYPDDDRKIETLTGEGARQTVVVPISRLNEQIAGRYNSFFHEMGHLVHQSLMTENEFRKLERLYELAKSKSIFHDKYGGLNSSEYFAAGMEAYLSNTKEKETHHGYLYSRAELRRRDPNLFRFIEKIISR
jgi:hypothetical protein